MVSTIESSNSQWKSHATALLWYVCLGALHELSHLLTARFLGISIMGTQSAAIFDILFERKVELNVAADSSPIEYLIILHSGWIFSLLLALSVPRKYPSLRYVAFLTAAEAISTDLLGLKVLLPWNQQQHQPSSSTNMATFFCGNFGVILLHHMWLSNKSKNALDCLQKMIEVTMMRGAQSGGVVAFHPDRKGDLQDILSRTVNKKRTDLSVLIRKSVEKGLPSTVPKDFVTCLAGHTRFATSSKATLDGTHPHKWTPATIRKVYDFGTSGKESSKQAKPVSVVNYITHNGDFDFYTLNGTTYDLEAVQEWLVQVTESEMPAVVDSCAIAGMMDVIRTQGCFALSIRYAIALCLPTSKIYVYPQNFFPTYDQCEKLAEVFEEILNEMLSSSDMTPRGIGSSTEKRHEFSTKVLAKLEKLYRANLVLSQVDGKGNHKSILSPFTPFFSDDAEDGASISTLCLETIKAFFDNDLFMSTKIFLRNAKGSFGLMTTSSLDADRQTCMAARGQTISIAFYPKKGLICYGSEQAAVKAGLDAELPGADAAGLGVSRHDLDIDALRLDLDDLGGEIIVLDWSKSKESPVSLPNRHLKEFKLMNGVVSAILYQESKSTKQDPQLYHRMTRLTRNRFIKPLEDSADDLVLADIEAIPRICQEIQDEWHSNKAVTSLNRLTAYNLSRRLRARLEAKVAGTVPSRGIDILVTGCEVSLWVGEQFASDLQKAFPKLAVQAVSSNKLLGLYGQEIAVPSVGFPFSPDTNNLNDCIVIIVSHSGGTFAPLACSNLLQSATQNIFVVTSEWDTQIGKQLRAMDDISDDDEHMFNSRIFTTDVGLRPAEPCSISVAATHQLLTNLFEYISVVILSDESFRRATDPTITEQDIRTLERCNNMNIDALSEIVGTTSREYRFDDVPRSCRELREAGDLWAEHVLENVKAYIMSFVYVFVTVTSGYPLVSAIAILAGLESSSEWYYLIRLLDSAIYFWLPQINITILRLFQGRNLLHRMVGRTVAIGDIPWVAQSAEAFLSKLFACSYSIAGLNVLSGNPVDHFVHRHTHRVTRGTLLVCGRPDGRLSKLSTAEASVCLSVNQASSIQSWGGTCESITIGHNPFKLPLSHKGIFLKRKRPMFLCERMLVETDAKNEQSTSLHVLSAHESDTSEEAKLSILECVVALFMGILGCLLNLIRACFMTCFGSCIANSSRRSNGLDSSFFKAADCSVKLEENRFRSAAALFGAYMNMQEAGANAKSEVQDIQQEGNVTVDDVVEEAVQQRKWQDNARKLFQAIDLDGNGSLSLEEFTAGASKLNSLLSPEEAAMFFHRAVDEKNTGTMTYEQFVTLMRSPDFTAKVKAPPSHKNDRGIIQIEASDERYFGATMRKLNQAGKSGSGVAGGNDNDDLDFTLAKTQRFSQELYETRIASLQRFVAMTVMFHQMAKRVEGFFRKMSFGLLGYRMDRTHSIMRIATTASPVSGADVRSRMNHIRLAKKVRHSVHVISVAYLAYKERMMLANHDATLSEETPHPQVSTSTDEVHGSQNDILEASSGLSEECSA